MRLFSYFYDKVMQWSQHRHAVRYLALLGVAEASFFPIPVDVMLAPMALGKPERAWYYAGVSSLSSVLGGCIGYLLGHFAFSVVVEPMLEFYGAMHAYQQVVTWFDLWGFAVILLAGFSPIPYKVFTIAAGALFMPFWLFFLASLLSRSARFYMVAGLMRWGGKRLEKKLRQYCELLGWLLVSICILYYIWLRNT